MSTAGVKVDPNDPHVRRLVYNMYRGILGQYNDKANTMVSSMPKSMVREDQGIGRQIESMIRQSSQISGGGSSIPVSPQGDVSVGPPPPPPPPSSCPPAPPPPPPPGPGQLPGVRLSSEIPDRRRSGYEPPAAIQNAMMTKDKKPFTYTPGGLDLSEIRSPRMARRINRNANAPDLAPPPPQQNRPSPLAGQPLPPSAMAAMQPQIAIAVLPQGGASFPNLQHVTPGGHSGAPPPPPPQPKATPPPPPPPVQNIPTPPPPQRVNRQPSPPMSVPKLQPQHRHTKSEPESTPGSIYIPPIENQTSRAQLGSLYIPPIAPQEPIKIQSPPVSQLNKGPTPWMSRQSQQAPKEVPPWVNKENIQNSPPSPPQHQQNQAQTRIIPIQVEGRESSQPNTRIIPIQLEGSPSPQHSVQQPNFNQHQKFQQQQYQQQQQQYQQQQQQYQQQQYQQQQQQQQYQQQQHNYQPQYNHQQSYEQQQNQGRQTPRWMNQQPIYVHNKFITGSQSPIPVEQNNGDNQPSWRQSQTNGSMQSPGPVQSQSFKVLQKMTGTDIGIEQTDAPYNSQGVPLSQLRKLELSDDDRALMNKVKSQVDDETFLHNESDPRYRGSAIPSRAFRILQTMTDGTPDGSDVPRGYSSVQAGQNRPENQISQPDAPQQYIPPSEQQVQEPRKYTGGAIPSRSFRMLQAMTAGPDNAAVMPDGRQTPQFCNGGEALWAPYPPPPYYYPPPNFPQTPEQQQQFWEHYNAMCSYMADMNQGYGYPPYGYPPPHLYTPPPMPPSHNVNYPSDSDECGYSSTDEMNYYAAYFKKYPPPIQPYRCYYPENCSQTPQIVITPSNNLTNGYSSDVTSDSEKESDQKQGMINSSPSVNGDSGETTDDGSDTEVEEDNEQRYHGLQTIKSVPDISIYKDSSSSSIQSQVTETDDAEEEEVNGEVEEYEDEESLPHQLSVIFEESEHSEAESFKHKMEKDIDSNSDGESSTETLDQEDDTDDDMIDAESSTVHVRLPLKLKFSKTENNEEVTTVIVGDSEIQPSPDPEIDNEVREGDLIIQEINKVDDEPEVSVTFTIPKKKNNQPEALRVSNQIERTETDNCREIHKCDPSFEVCELESGNNYNCENSCDKEVSLVVSNRDNNETCDEKNTSESPIDFWKELSCDDIPRKLNVPSADISISITLPPKIETRSGIRSSYDNLTSESDESRPEESDGHWEDDSSSTSIQTVRIGKHSGSDQYSGSEIETYVTADEVEDIKKIPCEIESKPLSVIEAEQNENKNGTDIVDESIPIEDLLYDDSSSSEEEDDDESSTSSSSSSNSSEESSEQNKVAEETSLASVDSKTEDKADDDVFLNDSSKSESSNHLAVKVKPRKTLGSNNKSQDQDESEEEDSGVTSDMSRHISETDTDPECGSELRKLTPYQRAATHSRLFKLLQDECGQDEENEQSETNSTDTERMICRKERLSLPLNTSSPSDPDSMSSSSGINSPASPTVSHGLVKELVQSLLHKKKGRHFRKLPMDKLYAAALRILQEDMDPYDTLSSTSDDSFRHSPISESNTSQPNNTANIPAAQSQEVYGDNYYDYCDYYNTWGNPYYYPGVEDSLGYDIVPSRAFKLLQERAQTPHGFSSGVIEGLMAKCPRVLSSKDVPKDLNESLPSDSCPQASSSET